MARTAAAGFWSRVRAFARARGLRRGLSGLWTLAAALMLVALTFAGACRADPVRGEATFSVNGGYGRLVLKLAEDIDTEVTTAGSILVIRFKRPVYIPTDRLAEAAPDYITSARRDPDGTAIRMSLARTLTINTTTAGERVFIDMLPDSWRGDPPSIPPEVVHELSERTRAAERALRQQRADPDASTRAPIRVRALLQPTFLRLVFEVPERIRVSSVLKGQKLRILFNSSIDFDLADVKVAAPSKVASVNQKIEKDTTTVEVALIGDVDIHSFREDSNYVVDVAFQPMETPPALPPRTSNDPASPKMTSAKRADEPPVSRPPGANAEPASGLRTQQTPAEVKPEASPQIPPATEAPIAEPPKETPAVVAEMPKTMAPGASEAGRAATADVIRDNDGLHLTFNFPAVTPAALFRRADAIWLVFDSTKPLDLEPIRDKGRAVIAEVGSFPLEQGQAIRIRLIRPQLPSLVGGGEGVSTNWTLTIGDTMRTPQQPLTALRNITDPAHANVTVPLSGPGLLHRLVDPDAGDMLWVVTAQPPARGLIKRQDFVELSLLESIHGVAIRPNSDDVNAELASDRIILSRPGGLTLSSAEVGAERATTGVRQIFEINEWRKNQEENFTARQDELVNAAAALEPAQRTPARLDLARFYFARGMYQEANGVLDLALADAKPGLEDPVAPIMRSVANSLIGRPASALKDLDNPAVGNNYDSQLWKALAFARLGKWADAREKFKNAEFAITSLPVDLQRIVISDAMRASLEVRDYSGAAKRSSDLEIVGISQEAGPGIAVLRGRLAEALGHERDALDQYRIAVESPDRAAAAEAKLLEIALRQKRNDINQADVLRELETLSVMWRGDATEVKTLQLLSRIYSDSGRFADSLAAAKAATKLQPNSEASRQAQEAAAALFAQIFLTPKGDDLPPIDALGIFFDYSELTPIGRRGDEMIRRLSDRLVGVDLLDQAAELLQYQIDHRLEGAARAQVAARLAMVYLANRKPERAIDTLRTTRIADLSGELRQERLLLEARAQSDIGRHDLALDIIANIQGREAIRLRSDIYWASRRWREASEQIELYYGDRWRDFKPLNPQEKGDIIRAVVGYALAEDAIGLMRFREKYSPLMSGEGDRDTFAIASQPGGASSTELAAIAKLAASVDTLDGFLREMKTRFVDPAAKAALPPEAPKADLLPTGSLPKIIGTKLFNAAK